MRKFVAGFFALAVAFAILMPTVASTPGAPALVIKDIGCGMLDGDGGFVFTDISQAVVTSSGQGKLTCQVKGVANSSGSAVHWNIDNTGLGCGTPAGFTADWRETVSASGNATLTCKVSP